MVFFNLKPTVASHNLSKKSIKSFYFAFKTTKIKPILVFKYFLFKIDFFFLAVTAATIAGKFCKN